MGDGLRPAGRHVRRQGDGPVRPPQLALRPRRVEHVWSAGGSRDATGAHRQRTPGGSDSGRRAGCQDAAVCLAGAQHGGGCRSHSRVRPLHDPVAGHGARGPPRWSTTPRPAACGSISSCRGRADSASSSSSTTGRPACTGCSATWSPTRATIWAGARGWSRRATAARPASGAGCSCTTASTA